MADGFCAAPEYCEQDGKNWDDDSSDDSSTYGDDPDGDYAF